MRNLVLEGKKLARPVLITIALLTLLTCILSCTLYRDYGIYYEIDAWEIGTEFMGILFPLFVTIPVCWQLYYERRNRFLVYTLPRMDKRRYLGIKWSACAMSAFLILFIPYFISALFALYIKAPAELMPVHESYIHIFRGLYSNFPLLYALLLSLWKGLVGILTMTLGFVLALYGKNIFVILTGPFIYVILDNFFWSMFRIPNAFVMAFEPSALDPRLVTPITYIAGPVQIIVLMGLIILFYSKLRKRPIYPV